VQAIVSLMSGCGLKNGTLDLLGAYGDRAQIPSYATEAVATATQRRVVVNYPNVRQLEPMRDITRAEVTAVIYQSLVTLNRAPAIRVALHVTGEIQRCCSPIFRGTGQQISFRRSPART
jgi:hypothetical protein